MVSETKPPPETNKPQIRPKISVWGILLRLMITIITAVILGTVIYFSAVGWIPYLDNKVFQPIDDHTVKIQELVETQSAMDDQITWFLGTIDSNQASQDEGITSYQLTQEIIELALQHLTEDVSDIQATVSANTHLGTTIPFLLSTLVPQQSANSRHIDALATAQMRNSEIQQEIELLKILALLSRANQFLLHSNFGQAEGTLLIAKLDLIKLREDLPPFQREVISSILNLVDQAIVDLPAKPALAAEKLELAWHLGINGLPQLDGEGNTGTTTPTPYIQASPTSTPTSP